MLVRMTLAAILHASSGSDDSELWRAHRGSNRAEIAQSDAQPHVQDDHHIVARIRSGDDVAFEQLFRQFYAPLVRFAANYVGSRAVAEEVVAELFSRLWVGRAEWQPTVSIAAALYGAARRRAIDTFRSRHAAERREVARAPDELWGMGAAPADTAWLAESEDERAKIWGVIALMPASQRTVLALRWRDGLSWDEMAAALGTTVVAVKRQHGRALATLRERFASHLR
jgi:RNA polymerase sigma-70 factor (ECF subfamily)